MCLYNLVTVYDTQLHLMHFYIEIKSDQNVISLKPMLDIRLYIGYGKYNL